MHRDKGENNTNQFRIKMADHWGNLGRAWRLSLDKYNTGRCCFNHFCRECHKLGIIRHLKNIWEDLTEGDSKRNIYYRDLDPDGDMVVQMFITSLTLHGGTLLKGWQQIIEEGGGHLHRHGFIQHCATWGIGMEPAKWLFSVLDPHGT